MQFAYRKSLDTSDALLSLLYTLQCALDIGLETRILQLDISEASGKVNHLGIFSISSALWVLEVLSCLY